MEDDARTIGELTEAEVIALFADPATPAFPEVLVPNGDDAAAWRPRPGMAQVATTDGLVEDVHFRRGAAEPHTLGRKLMAVNLSDLASMGAEPRLALIAVCLPRALPVALARGIGRGIGAAARDHGVHVIGGNVTRSPGPIVLHATLIGEVDPGRVITRGGAQPGDRLLVSGALGHARLALRAREAGRDPGVLSASLDDPQPRVALGRALADTGVVHAMCDVSDGLAQDVVRLLGPSGLGARLAVEALPMSDDARALAADLGLDPREEALVGGEDYELLFTVAPADLERARQAAAQAGTPVTDIGEVTPAKGIVRSDGRPLSHGFEHFHQRG